MQAHFADSTSTKESCTRDQKLQKTLALFHTAAQITDSNLNRTFSDFGDSQCHMYHNVFLKLFKDKRNFAWALSTNGAQLTLQKKSNTWILILILLDLLGESRYKAKNIFIPLAIPGPNLPGDVESFMWVLFRDMARHNEGIWLWDAIASSLDSNDSWSVDI